MAPEGWAWEDDWKVDVNRAVDEDGWEYCVEATLGMGWSPAEKTYHLCRRRRWIRSRILMKDPKSDAKKVRCIECIYKLVYLFIYYGNG